MRTQRAGRRWWPVAAVVAAIVLLLAPRPAAAQTRADSAAVLLSAAEQFEAAGRLEVADALFDHILGRFGDTAAAAAVRRLREARPRGIGERSGRIELQVFGTLYGAWLGVAIPLIAGADGTEPYGLGLLLGTPAGFLAARAYARTHQLTEGQARAITFGGLWGSWQGIGWATALDIGSGDDGTDEYVAATLGGGLAGIAIGAILARKPIPAGTATAVNFGALWGTWFGFAFSVLADLDDERFQASLVGGNLGLLGAAFAAPRWGMSRPRARLISIAGVVGGLAGGGVSLLTRPDDDRLAVLFPLAGSIAGLAIGAVTTDTMDGAAGGGAGGIDGALLDVRDGRIGLGAPLPTPTLLRVERNGVTSWRPAAAFTLLRARF
jgi:hypothetical protein